MITHPTTLGRRQEASLVARFTAPVAAGIAVILYAQPAMAQFKNQGEKESRELALTADQVQRSVTIEDDALEIRATLTTQNAFRFKGGFTETLRADTFLRAFVSKKTGKADFQVYQSMIYTGPTRYFTRVNFQTPDGIQTDELTDIDRDVASCIGGICSMAETVGFDVDDGLLRKLAATTATGPASLWRFKFKARAGNDWQDELAPAEIAGLLAAVDAYRRSHKLD